MAFMNQRRHGIILSYFDLFIHIAIGLLFLPFMLRMLGKGQYGIYAIAGSLAGYMLIMDFGLSNGIVRYISRYRAQNDRKSEESFLSVIFMLYLSISIIVIVAGFIIRIYIPDIFAGSLDIEESEKLQIIFGIFILGFAFSFFSNAFTGILKAYERFVFINISNIIRQLVRVSVLVIFLKLGYKIIAVAIIETSIAILFSVASFIYISLILRIRPKFHHVSRSYIADIFRYSFLIFIMVIADEIYWKLDNIILGIMTNAGIVAVYAVGMRLCMYFMRFSVSIIRVFFPRIVHMVEKNATGKELTDIMIRTGRIQALVMWLLASGFMLFGRSFIILWVGREYIDAYYIVLLIMLPLSVFLTQNMGIHILQAKDRHYFRCRVLFIISLINIVLTVVLIRLYGILGAAAATSAGLFLGNIILLNIYYHRSIGLDMIRFYKELCKGILPSLFIISAAGWAISLYNAPSWASFVLQLSAFTTLYAAFMWRFALNSYEKGLVLSLLKLRFN